MKYDTRIDESILRCSSQRFRKVSAVAAKVLFMTDADLADVTDRDIGERVRALVAEGRLESRGDLNDIRSGEIRLPVEE